MIVDAPATVFGEPEAPLPERAISDAAVTRIPAANFLDATIVIDGRPDPVASREFEEFVAAAGIVVEPFSSSTRGWLAGRTVSRQGQRSRGDDFVHTDVSRR